MKPAVALLNLEPRDKAKLPEGRGVVLIMCLKSNGNSEPIAYMKCDEIRKEVDSRLDQLRSACDGTLAYWVCTDPEKMGAAWAEAEAAWALRMQNQASDLKD